MFMRFFIAEILHLNFMTFIFTLNLDFWKIVFNAFHIIAIPFAVIPTKDTKRINTFLVNFTFGLPILLFISINSLLFLSLVFFS